jgi:hypothetical protein
MNSETITNGGEFNGAVIGLRLDPWDRLVLTTPEGVEWIGVEPVRAFPMTDPSGWISFLGPDGREILFLPSLERLDSETRRVLDQELAKREFVPVIRRILRVVGEATPADFDVETDRGATRFTLDSEDDIRNFGPHRLLITDSRKLRYQVPDMRVLDGHSRRLIEKFL